MNCLPQPSKGIDRSKMSSSSPLLELVAVDGSREVFVSTKQYKTVIIQLGCSTLELSSGDQNDSLEIKVRGAASACPSCQNSTSASSSTSSPDHSSVDIGSSPSPSPSPSQPPTKEEPEQQRQTDKKVDDKVDDEKKDWLKDNRGWVIAASLGEISVAFTGAINYPNLMRLLHWDHGDGVKPAVFMAAVSIAFYLAVLNVILLICGNVVPGDFKVGALKVCVVAGLVAVGVAFCTVLYGTPVTMITPNLLLALTGLFTSLYYYRDRVNAVARRCFRYLGL